ncbi:MAG: PKD domain-containing protein [Planctomycetes bacterium]|nr:PKD domain-containing protein [Planctomycetota bacterium]
MKKTIFAYMLVLATGLPCLAGTISGTVRYQNKIYNSDGFTGASVYYPVRYADAEIVNKGTNEVLGSGEVNVDGFYSIDISDAVSADIFLRVYAFQSNSQFNLSVRNNDSSKAIYTAKTYGTAYAGQALAIDLDISLTSGVADAFNIFDCTLLAQEWMQAVNSDFTISALPEFIMYWENGTYDGTYYDRGKHAIFLRGESSDSDSFDDDIILHELGHFIIDVYSLDQSPGGGHSLTGHYDVRLVWSEGVAHWVSSAIRRWVDTGTAYAGRYPLFYTQVDNFGIQNSSFDLELPSYSVQASGADNELSIASMLWDISDTSTDPDGSQGVDDDSMDLSLDGRDIVVWNVIDNYIMEQKAISFETFWDGWQEYYPAYKTQVQEILTGRSVNYFADTIETNDTYLTAVIIGEIPYTSPQLTFYGSVTPKGDKDWFALSAVKGNVYEIETTGLKDGADTTLELYNISGTTLITLNDDRAPGDVSSVIEWTAPTTETYYISAHAYDGTDAISYYGAYTLSVSITSQATPNAAPQVALSAAPLSGPAPFTTTLTANAADTDGTITMYQWDFDGNGVTDYSSSNANTILYVYYEIGTFNPSVTVTDDGGLSASSTAAVEATAVVDAPGGNTQTDYTQSSAPLTVNFTMTGNTSTVPIFSYEWDFESDGTYDYFSLTSPDIAHTYAIPGTYTANLRVQNINGQAVKIPADPITVDGTLSSVSVNTAPDPAAGVVPLTVSFAASPEQSGYDGPFEWDFNGDNKFDLLTSSSTTLHTYYEIGNFTVRVRAYSAAGSAGEGTANVFVQDSYGYIYLTNPVQDAIVYGNRLTLSAVAGPDGLQKSARFMYKQYSADPWVPLGEVINSTGTDFTAVFDVMPFDGKELIFSVLLNGTTYSNEVTVQVSSTTASEIENSAYSDAPGVVKTVAVSTTAETILATYEGVQVYVPYGAFITSGNSLQIQTGLPVTGYYANGAAEGLLFAGEDMFISTNPADAVPAKEIQVKLPYKDADNDGVVDVYNVSESALKLVWWDETELKWKEAFGAVVNTDENYVLFETGQKVLFGLFGAEAPAKPDGTGNTTGTDTVSGSGKKGGGGACFVKEMRRGNFSPLWMAAAILLCAAFLRKTITKKMS